MLLRELKPLLLKEAISITHLTPHVKQAIVNSILSDLSSIYHLKANLIQFKDAVDEGHGKAAREALSNMFYRELLPTLANNIDDTINAHFPDTLKAVTFRRISSAGQASERVIVIQTDTVEKIGNAVIAKLFDVVYDSGSDYFDDLFSKSTISSTLDQIERNRDINRMIDNLAGTVVHEMVHVIQHAKQKHRTSTEYRSYLGPKEEFHTLFDILDDQGWDTTTAEYARWNYLYRASPQEITAFAHDIANDIIQRNYIDDDYYIDGTTLSELVPEMMSEIKRYVKPTNPHERKVFNRYVKRVYQELKAHIDRIVAKKSV